MTREPSGSGEHETSQRHVIVAGCRHGGLAVVRALGPLGYRITALTADPADFAAVSRYVGDVAICPPPSDEERFVDHLLDRREIWRGALILDTEDVYTAVLGRHRDRLTGDYHLLAAPWEQARWFLEKDRTHALAESAGVPRPALHRPRTVDELGDLVGRLRYPLAVKPVRSPEFAAAYGTKLWVVEDEHELLDRFADAVGRGIDVVVQEVIPGPDEGALESIEVYVNRDGSWGAEQFNVKVRQAPPMWGVMRVGRSVPAIEDVREHTRRLLDAAGYRGYASAEYKRDPRDGVAKLIEVNARLPRNGQLTTASGTNFPHLVYLDLVEGVPSSTQPLHPTWFVDLVADVGTTLARDRGQLRRPVALLRPYVAGRRSFAVLSGRDPRPFVSMVSARLRKRIARWRRRRPGSVGS